MGENKKRTKRLFRFEKWWLKQLKVVEIIKESWSQTIAASNAVANLCINLRRLRRVLLTWEKRFLVERFNQKKIVMDQIQALELKEEATPLNQEEYKELEELGKRITEIYEREHLRWKQRAKC